MLERSIDLVIAYVIIALNAFTLIKSSNSPESLQLVHMIYRHGDRSPTSTFPTNPVPEAAWPQGFGQLTRLGMQQHFALGQYMRGYYGRFLSESYNRKEIVVISSDADRAIMSAEAHLAGLYIPSGYQLWNSSILWQPIPVHTVPKKTDNFVGMYAYCPRYEELFNELVALPRVQEFIERNRPFFAELSNKTGRQVNFRNAEEISDTLFCQRLHHFPMPDWAKNVTEQLHEVALYYRLLRNANNATVRFTGGNLLKIVTDNMVKKRKGLLSTSAKMFMYSGHDNTLMAFLQTLLEYPLPDRPPYTATVLVELRRGVDGEYFVVLLYKNASSDPRLLTMRGCSERCPLSQFISITSRYVCEDWREECGLDDGSPATSGIRLAAYIYGGMLAAVLLFIAIVVGVPRLQKHKHTLL